MDKFTKVHLPKPFYQDDFATIYHGDCREILPTLPKVDLVLTDPPYGYSYESNRVCESTTAEWMRNTIACDESEVARNIALGGVAEFAVFGNTKTTPPKGTKATLIWDKGPASGMGDLSFPFKASFEFIYVGGSNWTGSRDEGVLKGFWVVTRASMGRVHPNQKPVELCAYLIQKHAAQTILDPFMGSGTTLVAAKQLGRKAIGIELEEKYCEIAAKRLQQEYLQLTESPASKMETAELL